MRLLIGLVLFLVVFAVATTQLMNHYFTGDDGEANMLATMTWMWEKATDETVGASTDVIVDAMQSYAEAQRNHFASHGRYSPELSGLSGLPPGMAEADLTSPQADFHGYLFTSVAMNGATSMDYGKDFVLVAFPAFYPVSGQRSYAIGPKGIVIAGNTNGTPVRNATELSVWRPVTNGRPASAQDARYGKSP